ncbi:hypothetical protein MM239_17235 [Belliella sp. DSM 111904]|uniref:RNA polymerase sigma factor, sigma-70 family n=1 Tax=Belliella filtrata TaxID=2923435 RepID=A0ABS9V594_9BACT|nr:hypothetical protein [Belliella filtrata]MCH7411145.1 hypothetical protein [Belliella filtrata]
MNPNLINFVQKLTIKRNGKNQDSEDISQEVFINLILEGITEIEGNELRINHLIHYHLNKLNRTKKRFNQVDTVEAFDRLIEPSTVICNTESIESYFNDFKAESSIKPLDLDLFYSVKFLRIPYKELCEDNGTNRKRVNRVYVKFKSYLDALGVKLDSFYDE